MSEEAEVILKAHTVDLGTARPSESAQPVIEDETFGTPNDAIIPPESLSQLAQLSHDDADRSSIIDAIARNTVGLGYSITVAEGHEGDVEDQEAELRDAATELERLAARDVVLERPTFSDLLYAVKTDEEETGNGYLEVSRDRRNGRISGLYHAPGKRVRRKKDRSGYLLLPPDGDESRATTFYNFGEKVQYDRKGRPKGLLNGAKRWNTNELIAFKLYTSESRDYGLPRDVALAPDYLGDQLAREFNIGFFDAGGTPPTVIFVQGEETKQGNKTTFRVPQETADRIADTLNSNKGRRSRVAIIPVPPGTSTKKEQLGEVAERDMGFVAYRADNRKRKLGAFRMAAIFIADTSEGRYTAEVERALTLEQLFDPEQRRYEERLRRTVLNDLGYGHLAIKFTRLAVEADAAKRDSADKSAEVGAITRREYRKAHGYGPLPEAKHSASPIRWNGEEFYSEHPLAGQVPHGWNDGIINVGQPHGAEDRVVEGTDGRGLIAGLGGRQLQKSGGVEHVEHHVEALGDEAIAAQVAAATRAAARARALQDAGLITDVPVGANGNGSSGH